MLFPVAFSVLNFKWLSTAQLVMARIGFGPVLNYTQHGRRVANEMLANGWLVFRRILLVQGWLRDVADFCWLSTAACDTWNEDDGKRGRPSWLCLSPAPRRISLSDVGTD